MRANLTTLILIISLMQVSAASFGQKLTLKQTNVTMDQVFREIRKQTGYDVLMNVTRFKSSRIDADFKNAPLTEVMDELVKGKGLEYSIEEKTVVIKVKEESLIERIVGNFNAVDVRGQVVGVNLEPLQGASITVKNGKGAVNSGKDGYFYLKNVDENATLIITYIGYLRREIEIKGREDLEIIPMELSTSKLDEVQVQAYGITSRRLSTSNITTVKADEIAKQPVDNPLYALMGRVPGLIITPTSGLPGASVKLQIRGQNSLAGKYTQPLIIVDGIPFTNNIPAADQGGSADGDGLSALRFINPSDIESIDVLKDADATAIYGSRGANGVILITSKKGHVGKTSINVNAYTGFSERSNKKLEMLNTQQYLTMRREAYNNDGLSIPTSPQFNNYDLTVWDQNQYTDWQEELGRGKGGFTSVQASISGGNSDVQYLLGGTYNGQSSIFPGHAKDESGTGHFSLTGASPNQKFRASLMASYTANSSVTPDFTQLGITLAPNAPALYLPNGELNWAPNPVTGLATWTNPMATLFNVTSSKTNVITANLNISYQITSDLVFRTTGGITKLQATGYMPYTLKSQDPATLSYATGSAIFNNNSSSSFSIEPQLNYKIPILKGTFDALVGASFQGNYIDSQSVAAYGYTADALLGYLSAGKDVYASNGSNEYRYMGVFARATYNLADRYILNLNFRRDGSSRFGPGKQFGNFGSAGVAWVFSNEEFVKKTIPWLSFGKLRLSYGITGNDNINDFQYLELYSARPSFDSAFGAYQGLNTLSSNGAINPYYHWESTRKAEIGLDAGLFKDRLTISTAYFRNRSGNQLGFYLAPSTAGASEGGTIVINQPARIQNSGFEFSIDVKLLNTTNFGWTLGGNVSLTRNKLLELPEGFYGMPNIYGSYIFGDSNYVNPVGKPFSGVTGVYEYRGVNPETGVYQYADQTGNTSTDPNLAYVRARQVTTRPDYTGGISNQFRYKGFNLDVFTQFTKQMGKNYLYGYPYSQPGTFNQNIPVELFDNMWKSPGDDARFMKAIQGFNNLVSLRNVFSSDVSWTDASFIRIKNVSLSYNLPMAFVQKAKMQSCRIYINVQNPFTFTKYKGTDPETQNPAVLAPLKVFTAGFQIGL